MVRSMISKVMWVGRTASMVFGLALVLALVLGIATMALAAVPGDPFKLGQVNRIDDALTTLVGSRNGAMLAVDNDSTATGARALDLRVDEGNTPMRVNATAGKATNLNADKLDGKESSAFMPFSTYQKSTSTFGQSVLNGNNNAELTCDAGDRLLSGGVNLVDVGTFIFENFPANDETAWEVGWRNDGTADQIGIAVLCADVQ
jgi:hypothetical protein